MAIELEGNGASITCVPMLIVLRMFPGEGGGQNGLVVVDPKARTSPQVKRKFTRHSC